jgi:hypothetical protein
MERGKIIRWNKLEKSEQVTERINWKINKGIEFNVEMKN